jgi:hypothetical protein
LVKLKNDGSVSIQDLTDISKNVRRQKKTLTISEIEEKVSWMLEECDEIVTKA